MAIPKVKVQYVQDAKGKVTGVLLSVKDFERMVCKMEDYLDNEAVEKSKKEKNPKFYTREDIQKIIAKKSR